MKKRELLFLALGFAGGYALLSYLGRNRFMWGKKLVEPMAKKEAPAPPSSEVVEVTVAEPQMLSANASVTQPQFSRALFNKDWVMQSQVKVGFTSKSPFN